MFYPAATVVVTSIRIFEPFGGENVNYEREAESPKDLNVILLQNDSISPLAMSVM